MERYMLCNALSHLRRSEKEFNLSASIWCTSYESDVQKLTVKSTNISLKKIIRYWKRKCVLLHLMATWFFAYTCRKMCVLKYLITFFQFILQYQSTLCRCEYVTGKSQILISQKILNEALVHFLVLFLALHDCSK